MSAALLLRAQDLRKNLGGRAVLDGVSLAVDRGQAVAIMGPSGAGKTTLLRCLNGLERVDGGQVQVGAHAIGPSVREGDPALGAVRRQIGFLFQQWHLFAHLTVLDNVMEAPVHVAHRPRGEAQDRARALLDRVGIAHRAGARPAELSGGEQQRAALARALAMDPAVLLLDEPTSALDRARADDLLALLTELRSGGLALVTVTHDPRVADRLGAQVHTLDHGHLLPGHAS